MTLRKIFDVPSKPKPMLSRRAIKVTDVPQVEELVRGWRLFRVRFYPESRTSDLGVRMDGGYYSTKPTQRSTPVLYGMHQARWSTNTLEAECTRGDIEEHLVDYELAKLAHLGAGTNKYPCGIYSTKDPLDAVQQVSGPLELVGMVIASCLSSGVVAEAALGYRAQTVTIEQAWLIGHTKVPIDLDDDGTLQPPKWIRAEPWTDSPADGTHEDEWLKQLSDDYHVPMHRTTRATIEAFARGERDTLTVDAPINMGTMSTRRLP